MSTGLIAAIVLGIALFAYIFAPVRDFARGKTKGRLEYLRERKDAVYANLRDLNFEFQAGKFPEADYLSMRATLEGEAAVVLAEIDSLESQASPLS